MPPEPWKTLSTREVYRNKWMRVREDVAQLPTGRSTIYGVAELGHAAGVLPFISEREVIMVRQYRYITGENWRWEIPTGGLLAGEAPEAAAQRELMEEIGYRAGSLVRINAFTSSKSVVDETCHLFIGRDLIRAQAPSDDTEFLEVAVMPFDEVLRQVLAGEIMDAMTVIAVLLAARMK